MSASVSVSVSVSASGRMNRVLGLRKIESCSRLRKIESFLGSYGSLIIYHTENVKNSKKTSTKHRKKLQNYFTPFIVFFR